MQWYCIKWRTYGAMNFQKSLELKKVKKVTINKNRALNIFKSSKQALETAKIISLSEKTSKTILRELYEGLREYLEAIGYLKGYKFLDHESIGYFIRDILKENSIFIAFDRYRKIRNSINYYGEEVDTQIVKQALKEIPSLVKKLEIYSKII